MKKIVRLTESDLVRLVKRVLMEQSIKHFDYKQKYDHSLVDDQNKKYNLPVGHVWKHKCFEASPTDWLEDSNGIIFHCGDLDHMFGNDKLLKDMKGSQSLYSTLRKEYCSGSSWNDNGNKPGCDTQALYQRHPELRN